MGCGGSVPTAPDVVIPDPKSSEAIACTLHISDGNCVAYKGASPVVDAKKKWFLIYKTGSLWGGDCVVTLENFERGGNPEKPQEGKVKWTANFDGSPDFEQVWKTGQNDDDVAKLRPKMILSSEFQDEAPVSDEEYYVAFRKSQKGTEGGVNGSIVYRHRVCKWCFNTKCKLQTPGGGATRCMSSGGALQQRSTVLRRLTLSRCSQSRTGK